MAKARRTITVTLPGYQRNREKWRKAIHDTVSTAAPKEWMQSCADEFFDVCHFDAQPRPGQVL